ncbi:MAG TPA: hypothetical protein VG940_04030 [Gemmatimonadales bacterium]|nr:hypothetical protein [Gemmatimonadales bacterium]
MSRSGPLFPLLLVAVAACGKPAATPAADSAAIASAHAAVPAMDPDVRLAAGLTLALRNHPEFADSMWSAYKLTPAQFDSLKKVIAADSAKNAAYQRLIAPRTATVPRS